MKEKIKNILLIILSILVIIFGVLYFAKIHYTNQFDNKVDENLPVHEVSEHILNTYKLKELTIIVNGKSEATISDYDIVNGNIPIYEFDAAIETSWDVKRDTYVGVKLSDVLNLKNIKDYEGIEFYGKGGRGVAYSKEELDNSKSYLVVTRNGKDIGDARVTLLIVDYNYNYSVEDLASMTIY